MPVSECPNQPSRQSRAQTQDLDCDGFNLSPSRSKASPPLSRRTLIAAAALAAPALPKAARAAPITWRLGHNAPADFPLHRRLQEAANTIAARSEGQMQLEVRGDSELGSAVGLLNQLRSGSIEAMPLTNQLLATNLSVGALPMLGFAFSGYDSLWTALDGGFGALLRDQMKQRLGLVAMTRCWNFGFRQITTSGKVVNVAADIEGLRLRTAPEADFVGLLQALKAFPVSVQLGGLEQALRSRAIDGQESVLALIKAAGLYEVQSTCALTNHVWDGHWIAISGKAWSNLPRKLQDIVAAAFDESGLLQRQDTVANEAQTRKELEDLGMKFNAVDIQTFRQTLRQAGYYAAWQAKTGAEGWAALEKYTGRLI